MEQDYTQQCEVPAYVDRGRYNESKKHVINDKNKLVIYTNFFFDGKVYLMLDEDKHVEEIHFKLFKENQIIDEEYTRQKSCSFHCKEPGIYYGFAEVKYENCKIAKYESPELLCEYKHKTELFEQHVKPKHKNKKSVHKLYDNVDEYQIEVRFSPDNGYHKYLNDHKIKKFHMQRLYDDTLEEKYPDLMFYHFTYKICDHIHRQDLIKIANDFDACDYVIYTSITPLNVLFIPDPPNPNPENLPPPLTDVYSPTPNFQHLQTYLQDCTGMNVIQAWNRGENGHKTVVRFLDFGIIANHEDLKGSLNVVTKEGTAPEHGTASCGVIKARKNTFGCTGIANECKYYVYDANSLNLMLRDTKAADIVGLCVQFSTNGHLIPVTDNRGWFDRIGTMVRRGAIVLITAGDGGLNLRTTPHFNDYGDNGSILVGACNHATGRRMGFSNYNHSSSVMNSWGDWSVTSTGYFTLQKILPYRNYTRDYSGTASAGSLVTGALTNIQGGALKYGRFLNSWQMRAVIRNSGFCQGVQDGIGHRPNVSWAHFFVNSL